MAPIVVFSLYADPLHSGHLHCIKEAKKIGQTYIIVNNDRQAAIKKGRSFMPERERLEIVRSIREVDFAILSCDEDGSVCKTLEQLAGVGTEMYFLNGGDSFNEKIPESEVCHRLGIKMVDGVGGKIQSSSTLIKNARLIGDYKNGEINKDS